MTLTIDIQIGETSYIYLQVICKINKVSRINRSKTTEIWSTNLKVTLSVNEGVSDTLV